MATGIETGSGKAKCTVCQRPIIKGEECLHLYANRYWKPYICADCIAKWNRELSGVANRVPAH